MGRSDDHVIGKQRQVVQVRRPVLDHPVDVAAWMHAGGRDDVLAVAFQLDVEAAGVDMRGQAGRASRSAFGSL